MNESRYTYWWERGCGYWVVWGTPWDFRSRGQFQAERTARAACYHWNR